MFMASDDRRKEERKRNLKLIAGVLILSLGVSLLWLYFSGAFDMFASNNSAATVTSEVTSSVSFHQSMTEEHLSLLIH